MNGDGTEPDGAEADKWLRRAAEQGQQEAQALLASSAQKPAAPKDTVTEETLPDWCLRAEEGDAEAQYQTAAYFLAVSPQEGSEDAARYLAMAAEQGHPQACLLLAQQHLDRQEYAQAADLLRNAADCNLGQAAELLGECYARGQGVQQDPAEAERRFIQAAQLDGGERMVRLAVRYALGDGVAPSPGKAMNWVKKARDSGLLDAREQYDALVYRGRGTLPRHSKKHKRHSKPRSKRKKKPAGLKLSAGRSRLRHSAVRRKKPGRKKLPSAGPGSRPIVRKRLPVSPRTRPGSRHRHRRRKPKRKPRGQRKQPRRQKPPERPTPSRPSAGPGHRLWYTASALF